MESDLQAVEERLLSAYKSQNQIVERAISGLARRMTDVETAIKELRRHMDGHSTRLILVEDVQRKHHESIVILTELREEIRLGFQTMARLLKPPGNMQDV
jgi:predicted RND superfamily exporter protein